MKLSSARGRVLGASKFIDPARGSLQMKVSRAVNHRNNNPFLREIASDVREGIANGELLSARGSARPKRFAFELPEFIIRRRGWSWNLNKNLNGQFMARLCHFSRTFFLSLFPAVLGSALNWKSTRMEAIEVMLPARACKS
jgi:hypothetical protein